MHLVPPHPATTVGFAPVGYAPVRAGLRALILPLIELQALEATEPFYSDFAILDRARPNVPAKAAGNADPIAWGRMMQDQVDTYKRNCIVFRYVANAILNQAGVHETRPVQEYHSGLANSGRVPAIEAIARTLFDNFRVLKDDDAIPFRSPLEVLVTLVYGKQPNNLVCVDELAVLFSLLAQAVGIPTWITIDRDGRNLTVECETGMARADRSQGVLSLNPRTGALTASTVTANTNGAVNGVDVGRRMEFRSKGADADDGTRWAYVVAPPRTGRYPAELEPLIGSWDPTKSRFWAKPRQAPPWYPELARVLEQHDPDIVKPAIRRRLHRMHRTLVAENYGPQTTGAMIAFLVKIYVSRYHELFRRIVDLELKKRGTNYRNLSKLQLADAIANLVKDIFAYREEMWKVEEILSPLTQWELQAFRPDEQCHDCDDLSLNTMTLWESFDITSAVRLAGDPGKNFQYHVYPLAVIDGVSRVFDVSALNIYREMPHEGNKYDFIPKDPDTYMKVFARESLPAQDLAAAGYVRVVQRRSGSLL